jgi:hypothetical protein
MPYGLPEHYTGIWERRETISSTDSETPGKELSSELAWMGDPPTWTDFMATWLADGYGELDVLDGVPQWYPVDDTQERTTTSGANSYTQIILDGAVWKERVASISQYMNQYLHAIFNATLETRIGESQVPGSHAILPVTNSEGTYDWTFSGEVLSFVSAQFVADDPKIFMVLWAVSEVSIHLSGSVVGTPPYNDYGETYPKWPMIPSYTDHTKYYLTISGEDGETDYLLYEGDYGELGYIHLGIYEWGKSADGKVIPVYVYSVVKGTNAKNNYVPANQKMLYGMIYKGKHYRSPEFPMEITGYNPLNPGYSQYFHRFVDGGKKLFNDGDKTLARGWFKPGRLTTTKKYKIQRSHE